MTTLEQAQAELRKWREAAGGRCAGATINSMSEKDGYRVELCWRTGAGGSIRVDFRDPDPLTAARAAMAQTPWSDVGERESVLTWTEDPLETVQKWKTFTRPGKAVEVLWENLDILSALICHERHLRAAQLEERDARIGELRSILEDVRDDEMHARQNSIGEVRHRTFERVAREVGILSADELASRVRKSNKRLREENDKLRTERDAALDKFRRLRAFVERRVSTGTAGDMNLAAFPDEPSEEGRCEWCDPSFSCFSGGPCEKEPSDPAQGEG